MVRKLPPVSTEAYSLPGPGPVVVLLHGFTGSPYDLKPLALMLNEHGCELRVPLLLGHGTASTDLFGITSEDWLVQVRRELRTLPSERPLILGGLSMGALIAIALSTDIHVDALVLLSPALCLNLAAELTIAGVKLGLLPEQKSLPKFGGKSDIADPIAQKKCPSYADMPLFGLMQFDNLRVQAKQKLSSLNMPIFMAFGQLDSAIDIKNSHQLLIEQAQGLIFSKMYAHSKHVLSLDRDRDILAEDLMHFLTTHLKA